MGMVNAVVAARRAGARSRSSGRAEINAKSPTAQRMLKYAFNLIDDGLVGQQLFAGEATRLAYMTDEAAEGRDAFLEKRAARLVVVPVLVLRLLLGSDVWYPVDRRPRRAAGAVPSQRTWSSPTVSTSVTTPVRDCSWRKAISSSARALDAGCLPFVGLADGERLPPVAQRLVDAGVDVYVGGEDVRRSSRRSAAVRSAALFHRPAATPPPTSLWRAATGSWSSRASTIPAMWVRSFAARQPSGWTCAARPHQRRSPRRGRRVRVSDGHHVHAASCPHPPVGRRVAQVGWPHALHADGPTRPRSTSAPSPPEPARGIVIGSERAGLSAELLAIASPVRIPMAPGVDSLNAAAAAAVACYALACARARRPRVDVVPGADSHRK